MTHGFKEKYSLSYTNRIRKFDVVFRMFTKVVVECPRVVEYGLCFVKWNLICCIEEVLISTVRWICVSGKTQHGFVSEFLL